MICGGRYLFAYQGLPIVLGCHTGPALPARFRHNTWSLQDRHYPSSSRAVQAARGLSALINSGTSSEAVSAAGEMAPSVAVFTTTGCSYCKRVKDALSSANIEYMDIELSRHLDLLKKVKDFTGLCTVPQIFVGGEFIGGEEQVTSLLQQGQLQKQIGNASKQALPSDLHRAAHAAMQSFEKHEQEAQLVPSMGREEWQALQAFASHMKEGGSDIPISTHWHWLKPHRNTMKLADAQHWCLQQRLSAALSAQPATQLLAKLQLAHLLGIVCGPVDRVTPLDQVSGGQRQHVLVRLTAQAPIPKLGQPLNAQFAWVREARPAAQVAEDLRQRILALYDTHLSSDGRSVNYTALKLDPNFQSYVTATAELQEVDLSGLDRQQCMCFFINLYNALIIHALAVYGPESNTIARLRWFASIKYCIGGLNYSSFDMEHGILRGNAASPIALPVLLGQPQWAGPYFKPGDARNTLVIHPVDPRIHFALVCGAKSCPPIKLYTPVMLEEGLASASSSFCEGEVHINTKRAEIEMSSLFKWYASDFGKTKQDQLQAISQFLQPNQKSALERLLSRGADSISIKYRPYDWSMNST